MEVVKVMKVEIIKVDISKSCERYGNFENACQNEKHNYHMTKLLKSFHQRWLQGILGWICEFLKPASIDK